MRYFYHKKKLKKIERYLLYNKYFDDMVIKTLIFIQTCIIIIKVNANSTQKLIMFQWLGEFSLIVGS